jgi:MFS family permease
MSEKKGFYREIAVYAILLFFATLSLTLIAPAIKEFVIDQFNTTEAIASLFVTVEMLAYIIFAVIWGALSDKKGKRKIFIVVGFGGSAVMYFLMTLANSLPLLLGLRFLQGAITVMAWSLVMTCALDIAPRDSYGKVMGIIGMTMGLGIGLGAPIGGRFADVFGVMAPMYLATVLFVIATLVSITMIKEHPIKSKPESMLKAIKVLVEEKKLIIPYAYSFVDRFTVGFFVLVFPLFMANAYGASPGVRGMYLAIFLFPFALLQYPFGKLSDRIGRTIPLAVGSFFYGIALASIGLTTMLGSDGEMVIIIIMLVCGILAAMMYPPSIALTGDIAPKDKRGTSLGGFNVFGSLGFAVGPLVGGLIAMNYGYAVAFLVGGLSEIIVVLLTLPFLLKIGHSFKPRLRKNVEALKKNGGV